MLPRVTSKGETQLWEYADIVTSRPCTFFHTCTQMDSDRERKGKLDEETCVEFKANNRMDVQKVIGLGRPITLGQIRMSEKDT